MDDTESRLQDDTETRLRLVGAGVQTTLVGVALLHVTGFGFLLVFAGTAITLGGLV